MPRINDPTILNHADDAAQGTFYARDGKLQSVFAATRDVAEQKRTSQYARSLIEASLDPLITISVQGKITDVNEASFQATGVPCEQLIGTGFSDYFTEPEKARIGYQKVFSEDLVRDYINRLFRASVCVAIRSCAYCIGFVITKMRANPTLKRSAQQRTSSSAGHFRARLILN